MANVELHIPHRLGREEAASRVEKFLSSQVNGNDLFREAAFVRRGDVFNFSARVKGIGVKGEMTVSDEGVRVLVSLPWAARPFSAAAGGYVREYLEKSLL